MVNNDGDNIYTVSVMVEVPKGSRNKYEYDKIRRRIKLDRMLFSSVHYPCSSIDTVLTATTVNEVVTVTAADNVVPPPHSLH